MKKLKKAKVEEDDGWQLCGIDVEKQLAMRKKMPEALITTAMKQISEPFETYQKTPPDFLANA